MESPHAWRVKARQAGWRTHSWHLCHNQLFSHRAHGRFYLDRGGDGREAVYCKIFPLIQYMNIKVDIALEEHFFPAGDKGWAVWDGGVCNLGCPCVIYKLPENPLES